MNKDDLITVQCNCPKCDAVYEHIFTDVVRISVLVDVILAFRNSERRYIDAICRHRSARGHDRCWLNDNELYAVLGDNIEADTTLPDKGEFLAKCEEYWEKRQSG